MNIAYTSNALPKGKIAPKLFLLYVAFASMIMFFSAFCSALIVRKGDYRQAWSDIILPNEFLYSTVIILLSSITIQLAYKYLADKAKFTLYGLATIVLSLVFVALQYKGWLTLQERQIFFNGNPSGSYIYVISLMHGLHYVGGIIALLVLFFKYKKLDSINNVAQSNFNILTQYWHFIGLIWVALYLFFKFIIYK